MAKRRMISIDITTAHFFRKLPLGAQALYFQFVARADDDGFVSDPDGIRVSIKARKSDLDALIEKRYLLKFDSGIYVIKHWGMANRVDNRQYSPTLYREERALLIQRIDGSWTDHPVPKDIMAECSDRNDNRLWMKEDFPRNTHEKSAGNVYTLPDQLRKGESNTLKESVISDDDDDLIRNKDYCERNAMSSSSSEECRELFRHYGRAPNDFDIEMYKHYVSGNNEDVERLVLAFDFAARAGQACNWNYIGGIWRKWKARGHNTIEDIMSAEGKRDIEKYEMLDW